MKKSFQSNCLAYVWPFNSLVGFQLFGKQGGKNPPHDKLNIISVYFEIEMSVCVMHHFFCDI